MVIQDSPKGIASKAEGVIVNTDVLRNFVLTGTFREVPAGDNRASTIRLVPVEKLKGIEESKTISLSDKKS